MSTRGITRCVCRSQTFEEIKSYANEHNINRVEELQKEGFCCNNCKMCVPYVKLVLQTGETVFEPGAPYRRNLN